MNKVPWIAVGVVVAGLAGVSLIAVPSAHARGFRNPDQGAAATAQGEAFAAQADDASAIYYNPAGLTQVEGTQFTSGGYLVSATSSSREAVQATTSMPLRSCRTCMWRRTSVWNVGGSVSA